MYLDFVYSTCIYDSDCMHNRVRIHTNNRDIGSALQAQEIEEKDHAQEL